MTVIDWRSKSSWFKYIEKIGPNTYIMSVRGFSSRSIDPFARRGGHKLAFYLEHVKQLTLIFNSL